MTTEPFILQRGNRRALIWGNRVRLARLEERKGKKPRQVQVWPDMEKVSRLSAFNAGLLWTLKGFMEIETP